MLDPELIADIKSGNKKKVEEWWQNKVVGHDINAIVDDRGVLIKPNTPETYSTKDLTALHYAALYGKMDIVAFLLEKGAGKSGFYL